MKCKKLIPLLLSCLMLLETPLTSQAASFSSAPNFSQESSSQEEDSPEEDFLEDLNVILNFSTYHMNALEQFQLTATVLDAENNPLPSEAPVQISWSCDQPEVLSISEQGLASAQHAGTAVVTAKAVLETETGIRTGTASCTITVVNTISLNKKKLTLYTCETEQLQVKTAPESPASWESSAPKIAEVTSSGKIIPKKAGKATITAKANGVSASCAVTVKSPTLSLKSKATAYLSNPFTLDASVKPSGNVTWKSSNAKIASVSSAGKVTPKKTGTVNITASCYGIKKTCKITVKKPSVQLEANDYTIFAENNCQLAVKAYPSEKLSFHSSNKKVATVDKEGNVHGLSAGTATITVSVPGAKATCKITVLKNNFKLSCTSRTVMKGSGAPIYFNNASASDSVSFEIEDSSIANISYTGKTCKVIGRKTGTTKLNAYCTVFQNNKWVTGKLSCTIKVIGSGVIQQQASIAAKTSQKLTLKNVDKSGVKITKTVWTSSNPDVVYVNKKNGIATGKKTGSAKVTASVSYSDGTSKEYATNVRVSNPQAKSSDTVLSLGHSGKITLTGLSPYSKVTWSCKKSSIASVSEDGTVTAGSVPGKATVSIVADGKTIKHTIHVTNPSLKFSYASLSPNKTVKIELNGVSSKSRISYRSKKNSVATVSKSGVVTAHGYGTAVIVVTADGNTFNYQVGVAPKRAVDACNTGYGIMYSSTYSQALRMSQGYYDCSSLVFRSYGCDTRLLGGIPSWAPTAASMASYMEKTGKVIAYGWVNPSKLRPGDLIFYSGSYNGRYRNINHVSMYFGGGYRLEKPLRYYYYQSNQVMVARPIP